MPQRPHMSGGTGLPPPSDVHRHSHIPLAFAILGRMPTVAKILIRHRSRTPSTQPSPLLQTGTVLLSTRAWSRTQGQSRHSTERSPLRKAPSHRWLGFCTRSTSLQQASRDQHTTHRDSSSLSKGTPRTVGPSQQLLIVELARGLFGGVGVRADDVMWDPRARRFPASRGLFVDCPVGIGGIALTGPQALPNLRFTRAAFEE